MQCIETYENFYLSPVAGSVALRCGVQPGELVESLCGSWIEPVFHTELWPHGWLEGAVLARMFQLLNVVTGFCPRWKGTLSATLFCMKD